MIEKSADVVIYPYANREEMLGSVEKTIISKKNYQVQEEKNVTIITMDISEGGLRLTDSSQWISIQEDIQKAKQNVLIVFRGNIDDFKDENEKQFWIDALSDMKRNTGKNIWVIQTGDNTEYSMKRGIKYLTLASHSFGGETTLEDLQETKYIAIAVIDEGMQYAIKNVF